MARELRERHLLLGRSEEAAQEPEDQGVGDEHEQDRNRAEHDASCKVEHDGRSEEQGEPLKGFLREWVHRVPMVVGLSRADP